MLPRYCFCSAAAASYALCSFVRLFSPFRRAATKSVLPSGVYGMGGGGDGPYREG